MKGGLFAALGVSLGSTFLPFLEPRLPSLSKALTFKRQYHPLLFKCIVYCSFYCISRGIIWGCCLPILGTLPPHFGDAACTSCDVPHSSIESYVHKFELLELLKRPSNGVARDAVLLLYRVVRLVKALAVTCEGINLGKQRLLYKREAFVQPHLSGYPHPLKFSFHSRTGLSP